MDVLESFPSGPRITLLIAAFPEVFWLQQREGTIWYFLIPCDPVPCSIRLPSANNSQNREPWLSDSDLQCGRTPGKQHSLVVKRAASGLGLYVC